MPGLQTDKRTNLRPEVNWRNGKLFSSSLFFFKGNALAEKRKFRKGRRNRLLLLIHILTFLCRGPGHCISNYLIINKCTVIYLCLFEPSKRVFNRSEDGLKFEYYLLSCLNCHFINVMFCECVLRSYQVVINVANY